MKTLNTQELKVVVGGLAYTGGDYFEYMELMRNNPYLFNIAN